MKLYYRRVLTADHILFQVLRCILKPIINRRRENRRERERDRTLIGHYKGPGDDLTVVKKTAFELAECRPQSVECIS